MSQQVRNRSSSRISSSLYRDGRRNTPRTPLLLRAPHSGRMSRSACPAGAGMARFRGASARVGPMRRTPARATPSVARLPRPGREAQHKRPALGGRVRHAKAASALDRLDQSLVAQHLDRARRGYDADAVLLRNAADARHLAAVPASAANLRFERRRYFEVLGAGIGTSHGRSRYCKVRPESGRGSER